MEDVFVMVSVVLVDLAGRIGGGEGDEKRIDLKSARF
jgi:hypothetical protein